MQENSDSTNTEDTALSDLSEYIDRIGKLISSRGWENSNVVYRGESQDYKSTSCIPNLLRGRYLENNKLFEKSLFDAMRQEGLTGEHCYLYNAIDAQHGEFPSRLLDVTYNCLTALYFAITPYKKEKEDKYDDKDGVVYLIKVDKIFSPSGENTRELYNTIVNRSEPLYVDSIIFEKNNKFVDHCRQNQRIVAQQGAFILFQGKDTSGLPDCMKERILISKDAKKKLRNQLRTLFGIHTGSIYPEIENLVAAIEEKSKKIVTDSFDYTSELLQILCNLENELDFYTTKIKNENSTDSGSLLNLIMYVEHIINGYRIGLLDFAVRHKEHGKESKNIALPNVFDRFNKIIYRFEKEIDLPCFDKLSIQMKID